MSHELDRYYKDSRDLLVDTSAGTTPNFDPKTGVSWRAPIPNFIHFTERKHTTNTVDQFHKYVDKLVESKEKIQAATVYPRQTIAMQAEGEAQTSLPAASPPPDSLQRQVGVAGGPVA